MTADELCAWLVDGTQTQRDKLADLTQHVAAIRAMFDDDHARVTREIHRRLNSPKLAREAAALLATLAERPANPRPRAPEPPPAVAEAPRGRAAHAALEAAIAADPDAREAYAVYGDWLSSVGDPRGELVALGAAMADGSDEALRAAHHAHLAREAEPILGPLAACGDMVTQVEWYMGFVRTVRIALPYERFEGERPYVSVADLLGWFLDDPGPGRFVQHLTLGIVRHDDPDYDGCTAVLARRPRPTLRTLFLGDFVPEECELNWVKTGDLSALWPQVPNLRALTLRAGRITIGSIDLPELESLTTISGGLDADSLGALAQATWPALRRTSICVGRARHGAAADAAAVAPLLEGTRTPRLTALGIRNSEFTDELIDRLSKSPLLSQLSEVDVSLGTLTSSGVSALERAGDRWGHIALRVDQCYLSPDDLARLARCVRYVDAGEQRTGERYAALFE